MDLDLAGKSALVGGGSQGLGRGTAEVLAREGVRLAIYALDDDHLHQARQELAALSDHEVLAIPTDVRDADQCRAAIDAVVAEFGSLDILVTNMASDVYRGDVLAESDEGWREEFELYTLSVMRLSRLAAPVMRAQGGGSIINLASSGIHQVIGELAVSEIPRLATAGFAKYLAIQLAPDGIRVNSVLPGWIEGERTQSLLSEEADERAISLDTVLEENKSPIPLGAFGTAQDVGNAVAFLASDRAGYITGVNLRVDGGWASSPTG